MCQPPPSPATLSAELFVETSGDVIEAVLIGKAELMSRFILRLEAARLNQNTKYSLGDTARCKSSSEMEVCFSPGKGVSELPDFGFHQSDIRGGDRTAGIHIGPEIRSCGRLPRALLV